MQNVEDTRPHFQARQIEPIEQRLSVMVCATNHAMHRNPEGGIFTERAKPDAVLVLVPVLGCRSDDRSLAQLQGPRLCHTHTAGPCVPGSSTHLHCTHRHQMTLGMCSRSATRTVYFTRTAALTTRRCASSISMQATVYITLTLYDPHTKCSIRTIPRRPQCKSSSAQSDRGRSAQ